MDDDTKDKWQKLGERLLASGPEKFAEILRGLADVAEAQEIIAQFDWQLMIRGRPKKLYSA